MTMNPYEDLVDLKLDKPIWDRFFIVHNLVVVGSREPDGEYDLAPKHMAIPMGWQNYFGFVCTPKHRTYTNIQSTGEFTVSYPRPSQLVATSLSASPRCDDDTKPTLLSLPTFDAGGVDAKFLSDSYLLLECKLHRIVDGFGENSLITGEITAANVGRDALRTEERDDTDVIYDSPLMAYLSPGRFTSVRESRGFPFPEDFKR